MSIDKSIESEILKFRRDVVKRRTRKFARNNLLLQRGRFNLQEEWKKKRDECSRKLKVISKKFAHVGK